MPTRCRLDADDIPTNWLFVGILSGYNRDVVGMFNL